MRFLAIPIAVTILAASALAVASPLHAVEKYHGETTGRFIVQLVDAGSSVTHNWQNLNGFAGEFTAETLSALRANPNIESISEDGVMHTMDTQTNAPWGVARLSSSGRLQGSDSCQPTFIFTYDASAGSGVDIYVLDTGIYTAHSDFGGRAKLGATFSGNATVDGNGHGTHGAGTAAGSQYGVAKKASLIAVKVLSDAGSGSIADIVSGLNWVITNQRSTGRPSVVLMSLGGSASTALDNAITSITNAGIHTAVAAGNSNTDAGSTSPARALSANTVGATTFADTRAPSSNYGSVINIWTPGQNIISAWVGSPIATNCISGTSSAAAHVAGLIAYLIGLQGNIPPAVMTAKLQILSQKGIIRGIPSGTIDDLAHNA